MPLGGTDSDTEYAWRSDQVLSSTSFPGVPTTDTRDFAYDSQSNSGDSWPRNVDPTAANRSDGRAAPSVTSNGLGNTDDDTFFDVYQYYPDQQQQQQLTLLAGAPSYSNARRGGPRPPKPPFSFPRSIPTPQDIAVYTPFSQLGLRDEAERTSTEKPALRAAEPPLPPSSVATPHNASQRKATAGPEARVGEEDKQVNTPSKSLKTRPPATAQKKGRPRKQKDSAPRSEMPHSGISQRDDDGQRETPSHMKDGSLASSCQSAQSRSPFDFSRLNRARDSPIAPGILRLGQHGASQNGQRSLPDEKGFSIQIGSELFKLSGASIMSDAPSYFSAFFTEQLEQNDDRTGGVRTLFIDRDPETFRDIARHLQGYLITPTDGSHFVKLFADAQFYRLPRLQSQLFESEIFVEVGNENFRIPRDIFSAPGDTPNYFTLGFTVFFSSPGDAFPGLNPRGLLRPPAIHPPRIPNRSPKIFSDILHLLRGYTLTIQNSDHRAQLLKDARYYNLRGLEQKLIPCSITHNIERQVSEIVIRIQDIKPSQISLARDSTSISSPSSSQSLQSPSATSTRSNAYITYARPYTDEEPYHLVLEVPSSSSTEPLSFNLHTMRTTLFGSTKARITSLFQTVANKLNLPTTMPLGLMMKDASARVSSPGTTPLSDDDVKVTIDGDTHVVLDGQVIDFETANGVVQGDVNSLFDEPDDFNATTPTANTDWVFGTYNNSTAKRPHSPSSNTHPSKRHKFINPDSTKPESKLWTIHRAQWRLRVQPRSSLSNVEEEGPSMEIVMEAVKIEATSGEKARNAQRGFLE